MWVPLMETPLGGNLTERFAINYNQVRNRAVRHTLTKFKSIENNGI